MRFTVGANRTGALEALPGLPTSFDLRAIDLVAGGVVGHRMEGQSGRCSVSVRTLPATSSSWAPLLLVARLGWLTR